MSNKIVPSVSASSRCFIVSPHVSGQRSQLEDGRRLLSEFIESFLSDTDRISFIGFQSGFQIRPDMLLFRVEEYRSTLSLPVSILMEPREIAVEIVQRKLAESRRMFLFAPLSLEQAREEGIAW